MNLIKIIGRKTKEKQYAKTAIKKRHVFIVVIEEKTIFYTT